MPSIAIALISAACILGGFLLGMYIHGVVPRRELTAETRDIVKLGAAMITMLSALVIGLLISSAKHYFDTVSDQVTQGAAEIILLDRTLANYGPETKATRILLRRSVAAVKDELWPDGKSAIHGMANFEQLDRAESVQDKLRLLMPRDEAQKRLMEQALQLGDKIALLRWMLISQLQNVLPPLLLIMLVFWLTVLHTGFGLLAPNNSIVIITMLVSVLAVSSAIFIILEFTHPFSGMIRVSGRPFLKALEYLGH